MHQYGMPDRSRRSLLFVCGSGQWKFDRYSRKWVRLHLFLRYLANSQTLSGANGQFSAALNSVLAGTITMSSPGGAPKSKKPKKKERRGGKLIILAYRNVVYNT